jgi:hypothetical protein
MRYAIVEKDNGLFLGYHRGIFLFARENFFPVVKVPSYDTLEEAEYYISTYLPKKNKKYNVIEVNSKDRYLNLVDLIKQGYAEYTHKMLEFLPTLNDTIH